MAADILVAEGTTDTAQKSVGDTDTVTVEQDGALSVADTAIKWNDASTDLRITNDGTIESTAVDGRAINAGGSATSPRTITLINGATGIIQAESDAFRINTDITGGTVHVVNSGTILSTVDGQAIDFDAITSTTAGQVQIDNLAGGVIQSTDADALRPGEGAIVNNAGTIYAATGENLSSDGVDLQGHSGTINNLVGGVISGARHGITTDTDVTVVNYGDIIGRNGSGIGSDGDAHIINYGTIIGMTDGSANGDGDGIDVDRSGTVENYGTIKALGANGVHSDGRPNSSDGVTFGTGGTVINHTGALIYSIGAAVPLTNGLVINDGAISGGGYGVSFVNSDGILVNTGTIDAGIVAVFSGPGNDTITNSGTITSVSGYAVQMGSGSDQLTLLPGSVLIGTVDGGDGMDQITLAGDGNGSFAGAVNFEHLQVVSGNWMLTGASTFSDGTAIADGATLTGSTDTLIGAIDDEGTLTFDQSTDATFAGTLAGGGQLVKAGAGVLTLGDQAFAGATRIDGGALVVSGTMPSAIMIASGGTLIIDQPTDVAFAATLTGTGQLIKGGAGALTMGGQAFTGATRIDGGALRVNGTMLSAITVGGGGALGGIGTVGATIVGSGGTLAAGGGGPLTIQGDLVQQAGSRYVVTIAAGQKGSALVVEGTATLQPGASISLSSDTGTNAAGSRYTLLSAAGGISGSYTVEQDLLADVELRLSSGANEIDGVIARTGASLPQVAANESEAAVAQPLADLGLTNAAYAALTLNPSDDAVRSGLAQLTGEVHASLHTSMTEDALLASGAVRSRLEDLVGVRPGLWAQFLGGHSRDNGADGAANADRDVLGGLFGADVALGDTIRIGMAGGYTRAKLRIDDVVSRARIGTAHLLGYLGAGSGPWRLRAALGYAWNHIDTQRSVAFTGFSDQDRARYHGDTLHGSVEIGYALGFRGGAIEPFVRGTAVRVHSDGFLETGGAAAISGASQSDTAKFSDVGARMQMPVSETVGIRASLGWRHAFGRIRSDARLAFAERGDAFLSTGTSFSRDAASPTLDIVWAPITNMRLSAGYFGLYGSRSRQSSGRLALAIAF